MLPSQRLVCPAADDDFVKLLYSLQNCYAFEEKKFFYHYNFMKKSNSKLS